MWESIAQAISAATGREFVVDGHRDVGGGSINRASVISGSGRQYFVKRNSAAGLAMFEAEVDGLTELRQAGALRVPEPVVCGSGDGQAWLVMEYLALAHGDRASQEALGRGLAAQHRCRQARFGWYRDNTIGSTPQTNTPTDDWLDFWRRHRLGFQCDLAVRRGAGSGFQRSIERLIDDIAALFAAYTPIPSLLHGDLWSGNQACTTAGEAVIFDPAVYYGDRETDLAMTELFGGFGSHFYAAYNEAWPLDAGYAVRKTLYNLYHVINHYNLFGGAYLSQAQSMIEQLLSEIH